MLFTDSAYIGIDPASPHKSFTYAALDKELHLIALSNGEMEDVTAFSAGQKSATVAINAPAGVNRGLVREKIKQEMLTPHKKIRGTEFRLAEYELRRRGITVSGTPSSAALSSEWLQTGFSLYRKFEKLGFVKYPNAEAKYRLLETHAPACYCVMISQPPLSKSTLEGRLQRQLILYERGLRIKDPMDFFEEITRYKMTRGVWPLELLYQPEQLDALAAAYTAWLAANKPEKTTSVGNEREGLIVLPEKELKEKY